MSWEETGTREYPCPCKQSTYSVVFLSDDWNRHEQSWVMNCLVCRANYEIYSYWGNDSDGLTIENKFWVKKGSVALLDENENRLQDIKEEAVSYAKKLYLKQWLASFEDTKSLKKIWALLSNLFSNQPSLSAFYVHIKNSGVSEYLTSEFNFQNLQRLLTHLQVVDTTVQERLQSAKVQQDEVSRVKASLFENGFR